MLILYVNIVTKYCWLFISSRSFYMNSLGFSTYMSSAYNENLLLPFYFESLYFSCSIAMARTFNTMLIRRAESGHPGLVFRF